MGLFVAPLIAMEENQIRYCGDGGSSNAFPANTICVTALETAKTTHPTQPIMCLAALTTTAPALLASRPRTKYLEPLAQTP